jgi:hypothetical protein
MQAIICFDHFKNGNHFQSGIFQREKITFCSGFGHGSASRAGIFARATSL